MLIKKGQKIEVKGHGGRWKEFIASADFETEDLRWKLWDELEQEYFEPLSERCKIRLKGSQKPTERSREAK